MITVAETVMGVREYAGRPDSNTPNKGTILVKLYHELNSILLDLNLTSENWVIERFPLTVQPNKEEYPINRPDWGTPFMVETYNPNNPDLEPEEVTICKVQDLDMHVSSIAFAFFNEGGQPKVKVRPRHEQPTQYRVYYEPGRSVPAGIAANLPLLDIFNHRLQVYTAIAILPDCEWSKLSESRQDKKRADIANTLLMRKVDLDEQFLHAKFQVGGEDNNSRGYFGEDREVDDYYF